MRNILDKICLNDRFQHHFLGLYTEERDSVPSTNLPLYCITLVIFITAQVVCLCQVNNTAANPIVLGGSVHLCTT